MPIRLDIILDYIQPVDHHTQRQPSGAQHAHDLELLLPSRLQPPRQRDGHDKNNKVCNNGHAKVREEDFTLVKAVAADRQAPESVDWAADGNVDGLKGRISKDKDKYEGIDGIGYTSLNMKDAGDEEE